MIQRFKPRESERFKQDRGKNVAAVGRQGEDKNAKIVIVTSTPITRTDTSEWLDKTKNLLILMTAPTDYFLKSRTKFDFWISA